MKGYYCDSFELPLPQGHRFPMSKYRRLRERVELELKQINLLLPRAATEEEILLAHDRDYVSRAFQGRLSRHECRALGFPWSEKLIERSRRSSGATIMALQSALESAPGFGIAVNLAGGTHHAHRDRPQGFCLFNDSVIAAKTVQAQGLARFPLIIDCDVHQGNGSASILQQDASVFTFSIHGASNFPLRKEHSDLDVALDDGTGDEEYLSRLSKALQSIPHRFEADCVIYVAGADPYEGDRLGKLNLSKAGLLERDRLVFDFCHRQELPCCVSMAGGYAEEVSDIVDIHFQTVETACYFSAS